MKRNSSLLALLMLVLGGPLALAQGPAARLNPTTASAPKGNGSISGTVVDATSQQPVGFATITLTDGTGKALDGALCDDKGKFTIAKIGAGTYNVQVSFIGYQTQTINSVKINGNGDDVKLGSIRISPSATALKEVSVTGQRSLIEEKVDRTVYNAENDISNRGGDASDVLRKVPSLSVDLDGNVSLRGSQNLRILINNRPSTITAGSVADALKQIPADMIKSVEVITSPSAKYDAEGSGGIINIITKKNTLQGGSLSVNTGAGLRGANLGLNGSYRTGKMGFSLGGFGRAGYNMGGSFENSQTTLGNSGRTTVLQNADTRNNMMFGRYSFGWDFDINKYNFLSASVQYGMRNGHNYQDKLFSRTFRNDVLDRRSLTDIETLDNSGTVDVNLNYTRSFDKPQQELSILTQFSRNNRDNNFVNTFLDPDNQSLIGRRKNINESFNTESTVQVDYTNPIGKNQMVELGGKQIMRQVISDYETFTANGNSPFIRQTGSALSNVFTYNQNVSGGYLSYSLTTKNQYSFKAGARYEYTSINTDFKNIESDTLSIPSYGVLVPSANLSKRLKNGNTLKFGYNRRIQRPSIQFLNPNIQNPNQAIRTIGNPELDPEFTNNFEIGYNTFISSTSLNFTAFARNTNNSIQGLSRQAENGVLETTFYNIGQEEAYGFSIFGNINISNKLSINGGTDTYYAILNNNVPDPAQRSSNRGWVPNIRAMGSYNLSNGWGFQGFGFYRARQVQLQGFQGGFGIYSLNLKKDFNDKKGSIGFGAENFLTGSIKVRSESNAPTFARSSVNEMKNLNLKINFSYRIGKMTANGPQRRKKSVNNDDMKGGGGGDMQEGGMPQGGAPEGPGAGGFRPGGGAPGAGAPGAGQLQRPAGPGQAPSQLNVQPEAAANATPVPAEAITGKWTGKMGPFDLVLNLKAEGQTLTGTVVTPRGETAISNGRISGNQISYEVSFGTNVMPYRGVINGSKLQLFSTFQGQEVSSELTKQP